MSDLRSLPDQHCLPIPNCHLVNEGQVPLDGGLILLLLLLQLPTQLLLRLLNTSNREVTLLRLQGAWTGDSGAESLPAPSTMWGRRQRQSCGVALAQASWVGCWQALSRLELWGDG